MDLEKQSFISKWSTEHQYYYSTLKPKHSTFAETKAFLKEREFIRKAIDNEDIKSIQDMRNKGVYLSFYLRYAAERGQFNIIRYIGMEDCNEKDWSCCALEAEKRGYVDIVKYAQSKGANAAVKRMISI